MYYGKVELCGVNTSSLPILTAEEKKDLLLKTKNGTDFTQRRCYALIIPQRILFVNPRSC